MWSPFSKVSAGGAISFGVSIAKDTLSVATYVGQQDQTQTDNLTLQVQQLQINQFEITDKITRVLRDDHKLRKESCCCVLPPDFYQVLLIDKPDVKPTEYRAAAFWQAKEMLQTPIEDCLVDIFLPSEKISAHNDKLYVVIANKPYVELLVENFEAMDMTVAKITIREFALRNVVAEQSEKKPIAILTSDTSGYLIVVISDNDILFARRIQLDVASELYRSLEYYTTALRQPVLPELYVENVDESTLSEIKTLLESLEYSMNTVFLRNLLSDYQIQCDSLSLNGIYALGAALQKRLDQRV